MTIARPQFLLTMALGLIYGGFGTASAQDHSEHSHDHSEHSHAGEHDHSAEDGDDATEVEKQISEAIATLDTADQKRAVAQRFCPVMVHNRLGADGTPHKVKIKGLSVFVCCEGCIEDAKTGGEKTLATAKKLKKASASLATISAEDRAAAEAQKYCAIANKAFLGSKGAPIKMKLVGETVFVCCKGCAAKAKADPAGTLAKAEILRQAGADEDHEHGGHGH